MRKRIRLDYESCRADVTAYLGPLLENPYVQSMDHYIQHSDVTTLDHCMKVACMALFLARKYGIDVNEKELVTGGFLHDFYLYDWHITKHKGHLHGYYHPEVAAENARRLLGVSPAVCEMIRTHMFPLTLLHPPRTREAWLVCQADKWIACAETFSPARRRAARLRRRRARAERAANAFAAGQPAE